MTLEAGNGEEAQATESLEATLTGEDITIGFNPAYLLDGLGAIDGTHVHVAMTQPARPAAFASMSGPTPNQTSTSATCSCRCACKGEDLYDG